MRTVRIVALQPAQARHPAVAILDEESRSEAELEALRNVARERIGLLFRNAGQDAHLASLHSLVLEYRLERLA